MCPTPISSFLPNHSVYICVYVCVSEFACFEPHIIGMLPYGSFRDMLFHIITYSWNSSMSLQITTVYSCFLLYSIQLYECTIIFNPFYCWWMLWLFLVFALTNMLLWTSCTYLPCCVYKTKHQRIELLGQKHAVPST